MSESYDAEAHVSADYCYRHPDRQSWVLCQRCGRTICPECQTQAPVGVQCPECVREGRIAMAGASGRSGGSPGSPRRPARVTQIRRRPAWQQWLRGVLMPDSGAPVVSWVLLGALVVSFIVNFFTQNALALLLYAAPNQAPWEIWRYFTSALVQTSALNLVLNIVFFVLIGPTIERMLGRARFAAVLAAGAAVGSSAMLLAGSGALGLSGAMFGMFAAYFVIIRRHGAPATQFLIMMGINVVLTLVLSPVFIFMLVGGAIGGGGAAALFYLHEDRRTRNPWTPYAQIALGIAAFILLATLRSQFG